MGRLSMHHGQLQQMQNAAAGGVAAADLGAVAGGPTNLTPADRTPAPCPAPAPCATGVRAS